MTGLRERPSTQPPENRKAERGRGEAGSRSTYREERAVILLLYAAKIAAARLYARKDEVAAIIAALKAEESAALRALREREQADRTRRQNPLTRGFRRAARAVMRRGPKKPLRPLNLAARLHRGVDREL